MLLVVVGMLGVGVVPAFALPLAQGEVRAETCPNAARRAEQPTGLQLPNCRAYEIVSPSQTDGQDASDPVVASGARASVSGEALTYTSSGSFAEPSGATVVNQFLSRREGGGWSTKSITPLYDPLQTESHVSYEGMAFVPELTAGIASTNAPLVEGAPGGKEPEEFTLYRAGFTGPSYQYVGPGLYPLGTATDLSRVVFGEFGAVSEWELGRVGEVSVTNEGESLDGSVGAAAPNTTYVRNKDLWHAVSSDGSRVYLTSPAAESEGVGQVYVRVNIGQPQSPLAAPEASGTGTLTEGADTIGSLVAASGTASPVGPGSSEVPVVTSVGRFVVGQPLAGPGLAPGTTITGVSDGVLTLSAPTVESVEAGSTVFSDGPAPFAAGETISGDGISPGTTITAVASGELTLSAPAASSGTLVALTAGGGCTVAADACTVEISASQRLLANAAGTREARFWGASADGSKVFFTSNAELTEDANTGPEGNAANLYEYELANQPGERGSLRDLSVVSTGNGAGVEGVVQISEDGSYVYFVAEGVLATGATAGQPNLYVSHDGGTTFIATLSANDKSDWENGVSYPRLEAGPEVNTAVVSPHGSRLAFISEDELTGYDNQQTQTGECEASGEFGACREIYLYDAETEKLECGSCDPSGAQPVGSANFGEFQEPSNEYRARNLLEDGSLLFDSSDRLVPDASNGRKNVYEYEDGHVYAISDVTGGYDSTFLDASPDGADVFFASADQLLPEQGTGDNIVVYDARIDGGFPMTTPEVACAGEGCKPAQTLQSNTYGASGTATFSGLGNLTPPPPVGAAAIVVMKKTAAQLRAERLAKALKECRRDHSKKKRVACERIARRRHGPAKAKRALDGRRAGSDRGAGR